MIKKILFLITLFFLDLFVFSSNIKAAQTVSTLQMFDPTPTDITPSPSSSSSSSSSTDTGWRAPDCTAAKPASAPIITSAISGDNSVTLTWTKAGNPVTKYLVAYGTKSGSITYGNPNVGDANTTSYTVRGLSGGTRYYFRIKAINDCMPGDFSNEVSASAQGNIIPTLTPTEIGTTTIEEPAEEFVPISQIPSQLFDIALIVDETQINSASELTAKVIFTSFGNVDTPVEMTFTIVDEDGDELYRSINKTTVQTEGLFNKTFRDVILPKGKYTLVLKTLYNTNVRDEFKQNFEIIEPATPSSLSKFLSNKPLLIIIGSGLILILIFLIMKMIKKKNTISDQS